MQESGFTFIEVLVSVAIIGVLAATSLLEFSHYREQTWDSVHLQYYEMARTALEGRNDQVSALPPGSYRTVYKYYNWADYLLTNVTSINDLSPGMPLVPSWIYMYIREDNCNGQPDECFVQYIYTENCRTGTVHYFVETKDGNVIESSWNNPAAMSLC